MIDSLGAVLVVGYGLSVLVIGSHLARGQSNPETYYLADRTLGTVRVTGSLFSTFLGTGLLFTFASFGYLHGIGAFGLVGAAAVGLLLLAWAAPRINRMSARREALTLPELLDGYWSDRTKAAAATITLGLFSGTLAANLLIVGEITRAFLDIPSTLGIAGFGVVVIGYTALGGFRGVVWTDVAQSALIIFAFGFILPAAIVTAGTVDLASVPAGHLNPRSFPLSVIVAYLFIGLFAFFGSQDLFQRIFAAESPAVARRGVGLFTVLLVIVGSAAVAVGVGARMVAAEAAPREALYSVTEAVVPTAFVGLVALGFLALANSDADSQALTAVSNLTQDLLPHMTDEATNQQDVLGDRLSVVGLGAVALILALGVPDLSTLIGAVGSWFAILGFVVLATMYWDRTTDLGAFAALVVGFLVPPVFVMLTGNFRAATFVGLIPAVAILTIVSWLGAADQSGGVGKDAKYETTQ